MSQETPPRAELISFVVPVVERRGDLSQLLAEYSSEAFKLGKRSEFIFIVDDRQREAIPEIESLQTGTDQNVTFIILGGNFGESSALTLGLERAEGDIVVTLASYFQVDPAGLGAALDLLNQGVDMVVGRRYPRTDDSWFNRMQTTVFHWYVNQMTQFRYGDISCGFRAMRPEVAREIQVYGGLHRFIPILATQSGFKVVELRLPQRSEDRVTRFYGSALYVKRLLDVLTVFFLLKFTKRPLRFFGLVGLLLTSIGGIITGYLGVYRLLGLGPIGDRPLLLLGVLLVVLGIQTLSIGLIGEIIIFTHAGKVRDFRIAEIIQNGESVTSDVEQLEVG